MGGGEHVALLGAVPPIGSRRGAPGDGGALGHRPGLLRAPWDQRSGAASAPARLTCSHVPLGRQKQGILGMARIHHDALANQRVTSQPAQDHCESPRLHYRWTVALEGSPVGVIDAKATGADRAEVIGGGGD